MNTYRLISDATGNKEDAEEHGLIVTASDPEDAGREYIEAELCADPSFPEEGVIYCFDYRDGKTIELSYTIEMAPVFRVSKKS